MRREYELIMSSVCCTVFICSTSLAASSLKSSIIDSAGSKSDSGSLSNTSVIAECCIPFSSSGAIVQYGGFLQTYTLKHAVDTDDDGLPDELDCDNDNDAMPDQWEVMHNLNSMSNDASGDNDSDGLSNLGEYQNETNPQNEDTDDDTLTDLEELIAGTSPIDESEYFKIDNASSSTNGIVVSWLSVTGRLYSVMHSINLQNNIWEPVVQTNLIGSGTIMSYTNVNLLEYPCFLKVKATRGL